jgi:hypothetical protein
VTCIKLDPAIRMVHEQNFLDCVKSRKKPAADIEVGHTSIILKTAVDTPPDDLSPSPASA